MILVVVQGVALLLQIVAALLAVRLIWITRRYTAWLLLAFSILLIVVRRGISYAQFFPLHDMAVTPAQLMEASLLIAISLIQCMGILFIAPLFQDIRRAQDDLRRINAEVERQVQERTADLVATTSALAEANAHFEEANAELARSNGDLQSFAYAASHDLQEPLRKITSFLLLIEKRYNDHLDADGRKYIAITVNSARRMQQLINDLLTYSRVRSREPDLHPVASEQVLANVLSDLTVVIEENAAAVTHDPLPVLLIDETHLTQVFQNLIGNAIKFRGAVPPAIHVGARREDGLWHFTVSDNGIGFDMKYAERIFGIFQRLHTRDEYEGTGIGLAVCRRIVESYHGRLWGESVPGEGSTFHFTLPAADAGRNLPSTASTAGARAE